MAYPIFLRSNDLVNVKDKDKVWAAKIVEDYYFGWGAKPLTGDQDAELLRSYASGNQSIAKIKKSLFRLTEREISTTYPESTPKQRAKIAKADLTGIDWTPVGVMFNLLNSAKANVMKQPINPVCTAIDPVARNHKEEDMLMLKNEKFLREEMEEMARQLKIKMSNKRDLKYGELLADIDSVDLDPQKDDELALISTMFYKLLVESALETALQYDEYANKMNLLKNKILDDHYVLGVSCYEKYMNETTGLPDCEYWRPDDVFAPYSEKPDYSDVPFIYGQKLLTIEQVIKFFGSEFKNESQIAELFDATGVCNKWKLKWKDYVTEEDRRRRNRLKVNVIKMQWKVWDGQKIVTKEGNNGKDYTEVKDIYYEPGTDKVKSAEERWKQCTYEAYYFPCAKLIYGLKKLDATFNGYGDQSMSMFGWNIYKSAERSPVALSTVLVDNFQRAFFKAQHSLLKSRPAGYYINLKHLRNAAENIKDDNYTWKDLLAMFFQENILMGDSSDFDEKETFNNPAISQIPGTNMDDVFRYWSIMASIKSEIREITGINEFRDATTPNPDTLVGLQKLALEASVNATYYIDDAIKHTLEDGMRWAACLIQYILKPENKGKKPYEAIMAFAGRVKPEVIASMGELHAHQLGIKIEEFPTEAQKQFTQAIIMEMFKRDKLDAADLFALTRIQNYKDAQALAIIRQRKKEISARKDAQFAVKAQLAKEAAVLASKEKVATIIAQGEVTEEQIKAAANEKLTKLQGEIDLLLQQLKAQSTTAQINQRAENKLGENAQKSAIETSKEMVQT